VGIWVCCLFEEPPSDFWFHTVVESGDEDEDDEDVNEIVVLAPDHRLMTRFQARLKKHLEGQKYKLTIEMHEVGQCLSKCLMFYSVLYMFLKFENEPLYFCYSLLLVYTRCCRFCGSHVTSSKRVEKSIH